MILDDQKENSINIKEVIAPYIKYWYIYIVCIFIALAGVKIYSRYIIPKYNTSATILIKDTNGNSNDLSFYKYPGINGFKADEIDNDLLILRSKSLLKNVVENLNLYTTFTRQGKILITEIYNELPLKAIVELKDSSAIFSKDLILSFNNENIFLQENKDDIPKKYNYNQPIKFTFGNIRFIKKVSNIYGSIRDININIADAKTVTNRLKGNITIEPYEDYSSAIIISMSSSKKQKAKDIINNLINLFNKETIKDKNIEAQKTSNFINERIKIINKELSSVEDNIANFKEKTNFKDPLNYIGNDTDEIKKIGREILDIDTKKEFTNIYKDQIKKTPTNEILPLNLLSQNNELSSYISQYNKIIIESNIQKQVGTDLNPVIASKNEQLHQLKQAILNSIQKELNLLNKQKSLLNDKLSKYEQSYNKIPGHEKILRAINRQQNIKENLYLLLLQKREENEITLAKSSEKAKLIDAPESIGPINTNLTLYYLGAGLAGLIIPISVIYLLSLFNTKIKDRKDLSKIIKNISLLGEIPTIKKSLVNNIVSNDFSILSEAFRIIRTNLQFVIGNIKKNDSAKTILVTSSIKGEGKTFISINLAHVLSQLDEKRIIIIGADIRNPQLQRYIPNSRKKIGLTEYLCDDSLTIDDIILSSPFDNRTSIILSGAIPINPTELIMSKKLEKLINSLKSRFDFIIIDSAPLLLVSDTYYISSLADLSIIVARANFTEKQLIEVPLKAIKERKINHAVFLLNDVNPENKYGYNYGYGYGYHKEKKRSFLRKIINRLKK